MQDTLLDSHPVTHSSPAVGTHVVVKPSQGGPESIPGITRILRIVIEGIRITGINAWRAVRDKVVL